MAQYRGYKGSTTQTYRKLYGYKNLIAWQAADDLSAHVHDLAIRFGRRYYKLTNKMLGSASSVKANIAEGYCRNALGDTSASARSPADPWANWEARFRTPSAGAW
jgi:hypothetical protein